MQQCVVMLLSGITLAVSATSISAVSYNITNITVDPNLVADGGNATTGTGLPDNVISNDKFTNTTSFAALVIYEVVPVSSEGCKGSAKQVALTVQPKPVIISGLSDIVCSGVSANIILSITNSVAGTIFNWSAPVNTGGMTGGTTGPSILIADVFENNTGSTQTATYTVIATSGDGCQSDPETVIVTVNPGPAVSINDGSDTILLCGGEDLQLNGNPTGGSGNYVTHSWTGQVAPLSSTTIQNPVFNTTGSGNYRLSYMVTDDNGCSATD
ncbi:unnamed protein product, partial [marine sediment metagenome]